MKKLLTYALGAATLLGACTNDTSLFEDRDVAGRPQVEDVQVHKIFKGLEVANPGLLNVKLSSEAADELNRPGTRSISSDEAPALLSATLEKAQAIRIERVFPDDLRFKKRMHREGLDRWFRVVLDDESDLQYVAEVLSANKDVIHIEGEYSKVSDAVPVPTVVNPERLALPQTRAEMPFDDPYLAKQWHYNNTGQTSRHSPGCDIGLFDAWKIETGRPDVVVAVIDGGVDLTHEDLLDNLWINKGEIPGNGIDDDGNGYVDDYHGLNTIWNSRHKKHDGDIYPDAAGHGTHVAGTIAARNGNGKGVCGIAGGDGSKDSGVRIMSCQILGDVDEASKHADQGDSYKAFVYAANHGAVIANNSWGYTEEAARRMTDIPKKDKESIDYFIKYAGCDNDGNQLPESPMKGGVVIFAAGNDNGDFKAWPAPYEPVVAVSAIAPDWRRAYYSNYADWVDISAPGGDANFANGEILSTVPKSIYGRNYDWMQGTSMACPHVTGIAALIASKFGGPGFTSDQLKELLLNALKNKDIDKANPGYEGKLGLGYVDAPLALAGNDGIAPDAVAGIDIVPDVLYADASWLSVADKGDGVASRYYIYVSKTQISDFNVQGVKKYVAANPEGAPGTRVNYRLENLEENTDYFLQIVSVDRWGNASEPFASKFKTKINEPPVIENIPSETFRICSLVDAEFKIKVTDPEGRDVKMSMEGDTECVKMRHRGLYAYFTLSVGNKDVEPGEYSFKVIATDHLGKSTDFDVNYVVYNYVAPKFISGFNNVIVALKQRNKVVDLEDYLEWDRNFGLTVEAKSSDSNVVSVSSDDSMMFFRARGEGEALITVSVTDGVCDPIVKAFTVTVVVDEDNMAYKVYPLYVEDYISVTVNPDVKSAEISVRNMMGERVFHENYSSIPENGKIRIRAKKFAPGTYSIIVEGQKKTYKKTFVKL